MFEIGDRVIYGAHGVCCVVNQEERVVDRKRVQYLALEPVGKNSARYLIPTQNAAAMAKLRPMLSKTELSELLSSGQVHQDCWITDENRRKQTYRTLIVSGDRAELMKMVATLYRRKAELSAVGKKAHQCDDNFLQDAEKLLSEEVAAVMGMEFVQAKEYLRRQLKG